MPAVPPEAPPLFASVPQFATAAPQRVDWRYLAAVWAASLAVHAVLFTFSLILFETQGQRFTGPEVQNDRQPRAVTPLVAPPAVMTQRAPNRGKVTEEFDMASLPPRPAQSNVPASPGAAAMPRQRFSLPKRQPGGAPSAAMPDAPTVDPNAIRAQSAPPAALGVPIPGPPPQIQPVEKPKLTFESPGVPAGAPTGLGRVPVPKPASSIEEAARAAARSGGRGLIVGDDDGAAGANPSSPAVPIPGKLGSAVELLSDPMGVDFWPYLVKVLNAVRRNWFAVIPESARLGRQGRTAIQFAISRDGAVPKLVIATPSGTEALDRAAVAGISASNPFPPLPADFKGREVRLQFVFKYNVR